MLTPRLTAPFASTGATARLLVECGIEPLARWRVSGGASRTRSVGVRGGQAGLALDLRL